MPEGYEALKPYWEAWKANNRTISDPKEAELRERMIEIFKSVAGEQTEKADPDAVQFISDLLPGWRSQLMSLSEGDKSTGRVILYRGVTDDEAITIRKAQQDRGEWYERTGEPISYSVNIEAALSFAMRGHINGIVYSISAPLDAIVFSDLDGHYQEGGLQHEKEVIVWLQSLLPVNIEKPNVAARKPTLRNRSQLQKWEEDKQKLEEKQNRLLNDGRK